MPYPRAVILEACNFLGEVLEFHGALNDLLLRWGLDTLDDAPGSIRQRCVDLFRFVRDHPDTHDPGEGCLVSDLIVEEASSRTSERRRSERLDRALARAGYLLEDGQLRRALPEALDLPAADDDVHALLKKYGLSTPLGHLEQAIQNHARGNWAAANSQSRSFLESLLDEIAYKLVSNPRRGPTEGEARREALAQLQPPFLLETLNEWGNGGKNLVNGVFKRLHPQGSHPGLSDEEDSTFRLHLVLLLGRLFLRRFAPRSP